MSCTGLASEPYSTVHREVHSFDTQNSPSLRLWISLSLSLSLIYSHSYSHSHSRPPSSLSPLSLSLSPPLPVIKLQTQEVHTLTRTIYTRYWCQHTQATDTPPPTDLSHSNCTAS